MTQAAEAMAAQPPPEEKNESKTKKALKGLLDDRGHSAFCSNSDIPPKRERRWIEPL